MRERLEARGRPIDPLDVTDCDSPEIVEGSPCRVSGEGGVLVVEKNASAAALSKHDPTRPMHWRMSSRRHNAVNAPEV
jgi:hypothetical protein